jgi:hypothetical protein
MQIPQTTYNEFPATAKNGMPTKNGPERKESRFASNFVTVGAFAIMNLPADSQCKAIPDATATFANLLLAVALDNPNRSPFSSANATSGGGGQYADGDDVLLMSQGELSMYAENACTAGHPVFVRCTAAGADVTGQIRDGAAANFVQHPTAVFKSTTAGAGLVKVKVA